MKKELMRNLGNMVGQMMKEGIGKSADKTRSSGDVSGNPADSIVDQVTGAFGGRGGAGCGSGGGGGRGSGGGRGGGGGRRCS